MVTGGITDSRRLDLQHSGSVVGQELGAVRTGSAGAQVQDP